MCVCMRAYLCVCVCVSEFMAVSMCVCVRACVLVDIIDL